MIFSKIRLHGFKSFVDPTEVLIEPGLSGVVGPNGCGKSNLVEALRWVMGESSYKNMRASGMDDVIFSGAQGRPARNMAEVTVFLDNSERKAPAAFNDSDALEVSRRIEREAGSAYRINGRDVRARDVQLLFADASTGARSPSMVRQGQIGELISAKPTARRQILEEAAGITGLHNRRHEAELRLRAAETNLDRLEDVLTQLDTQLDSLKRQARQANRFRNLSSEIRKAEATVFHVRWREAQSAVAEADQALKGASSGLNEITTAQATAARNQAVAAHAMEGLRQKEAEAAAALQRVNLARGELDAEEARLKGRMQELTGRLAQLTADFEREQGLIADNKEALERLSEEERQLNADAANEAETAQVAAATLASAEADLEVAEKSLLALTENAAERNARRSELIRAKDESERAQVKARSDLADLDVELDKLAQNRRSLSDLDERRQASVDAEVRHGAAQEAVDAANWAVESAREAHNTALEPLRDAERDLEAAQAEARTLAGILQVESADLWPPIVDKIRVEPGYEAALGAALGGDLDASTDTNAPVYWRAAGTESGDHDLPVGAEPLAARIKDADLLSRRLTQIGLVDTNDGPRLQKQLKPGQRLVSRDGDMWRWDGFTVRAEAPTPSAQRLAQKNRLDELTGIVEGLDQRAEDARTAHAACRAALDAQGENAQAAQQALRQAQSQLDAARARAQSAERELTGLESRHEALTQSRLRMVEGLEIASNAAQQIAQDFDSLAGEENLDEEIAQARSKVAQKRGETAEARAAVQALTREAELRQRRIAAIASERQNWVTRVTRAEEQITVLKNRVEDVKAELATLEDLPGEIEAKRRGLLSRISETEAARSAAADALAEGDARLGEADRTARHAAETMAQAREQQIRSEERLQATRTRQSDIETQIHEVLDIAPAMTAEVAGIKPDTTLPDLEVVEKRLERLRNERERLGGVNLRADEEAQEIDAQRSAMIAERDDLIEAIKRLRQAIYSLNREARERLLAAFDTVDNHFQELFTHLFGGGTARLELVDAEDPLEAGLEIIARPPGKKPQTMTLLSGGEQALTALALIFAVFLTNPAPICVLDEVDAPLDDANVERFCNLMNEMRRKTDTRFVIITHNPITMARMDRLFGVTMAERGVSQLVSVDLETAEQFQEAS